MLATRGVTSKFCGTVSSCMRRKKFNNYLSSNPVANCHSGKMFSSSLAIPEYLPSSSTDRRQSRHDEYVVRAIASNTSQEQQEHDDEEDDEHSSNFVHFSNTTHSTRKESPPVTTDSFLGERNGVFSTVLFNDRSNTKNEPLTSQVGAATPRFYQSQAVVGKLQRVLTASHGPDSNSSSNRNSVKTVRTLFDQCMDLGVPLTPDICLQCIKMFVRHEHLQMAMHVIQRWTALGSTTPQQLLPLEAYQLICDGIGNNAKLPYSQQLKGGLHPIIDRLIFTIQETLPNEQQHICLTRLLLNLVKYQANDVKLDMAAKKLYAYLTTQEATQNADFPFDPNVYKEIIHHSANQTNCYLPVDEILNKLVKDYAVEMDMETVMILLQKEYPFAEMGRVVRILDCIPTSMNSSGQYRLDIGIMEQIMMRAGRKKLPDVIMRVWDFVEQYQYRPTESMYESAIHAFFLSYKSDHFGFAVMKEMELQAGYIPSRAFIRTISKCIRSTPARIDNAYYLLTDTRKGKEYITVASMNCILSAYGEAGCIERAFATFDDLLEYELEPDHDSFSFLMESLATHVKTCVGSSATTNHPARVGQTPVGAVKRITTQLHNEVAKEGQPQRNDGAYGKRVEAQLSPSTDVIDFGVIVETADGILGMIEERGMQLDHNTLHQYIRLLAYTGKTERVKSILEDAECRILLETLSLLAFQIAWKGNIEMGKEIANMILKAGYRQIPFGLQQKLKEFERNRRPSPTTSA